MLYRISNLLFKIDKIFVSPIEEALPKDVVHGWVNHHNFFVPILNRLLLLLFHHDEVLLHLLDMLLLLLASVAKDELLGEVLQGLPGPLHLLLFAHLPAAVACSLEDIFKVELLNWEHVATNTNVLSSREIGQ